MSARRTAAVAAMVAAVLFYGARTASPAVRVDQDEVIFTLSAPGASEVYLVGDFNQWNPTVERMSQVGDQFEIGLFLVAGDYHYQFVVDGRTIDDPDNPGRPGARGSLVSLVERGTGLVLSTEPPGTDVAAPHARAGIRYIGALRARDDSDVNQRVDATLNGRYDRLRAKATVASDDSSWVWSPASIDAFFDRGRVEVQMNKWKFAGVENDSTWASSDPTSLVGRAGVYGYDAGFRRHGVTGDVSTSHVAVRALYADATTRAPATSASVPAGDLDGFVSGTSPDTTVYATRATFDASDVLAVEGVLSLHGTGAGVVWRSERGVNPGLAADVERRTSDFASTVYATSETRSVTTAWLRRDDAWGARVTGGFGWGSVEGHASGAGTVAGDLSGGVDAAAATAPADRTFPVLETRRGAVEIGAGQTDALAGSARWDFTRFDFDGVRGASRADMHRVTLEASDAWDGWRLDASAAYTHADYGASPDALAIDWPELNPWLSMWDDFDVPAIVGLAFDRYDVVRLGAEHTGGPATGGAEFTLEMQDVAGRVVHASGGAHADWSVRGPWYAYADVRAAWYDDARWASDGTRWSGYLEAGYRRGGFTLNAGIGFDPSVFNPVTAEYADIGRSEFLREALAGGVARSRADAVINRLIDRERSLEDAGVFKLECVIDLR